MQGKVYSSIKYIMMEMFSKCASFELIDCNSVFKGKTGEIMKYLKNFPQYNKWYINLNKIIVKIPEILLKIYNLENELADELIAGLLLNNSYFEFTMQEDDPDYQNDLQYFQLISLHLAALKEFLIYLNDFQDLFFNIKQLNPMLKKKTMSLNPTPNSSFSTNIYNESMQFSEDKLKHIIDKFESLRNRSNNFLEYFEQKEVFQETGLLNLAESVFTLVDCLETLFSINKSILMVNALNAISQMVKVFKYLNFTQTTLLGKQRIYSLLSSFLSDCQHKQNLLLSNFFNHKRAYLISSMEETSSCNGQSKSGALFGGIFNSTLKKEIFIEKSKYIEYMKKKLLSNYLCWVRIYFNKKKFMNSIDYSSLNSIAKTQYANYYSEKGDLIQLNSITENCEKPHDDDQGALIQVSAELKGLGSCRIRHSNNFYMFQTVSSYILIGLKIRDKYDSSCSVLKQAFNSIEEKFACLHIYEMVTCLNQKQS